MKEVFKDIPGYEGLYKVSNKGNVFSIRRNRLMTLSDSNGYLHLTLSKNSNKKWPCVHQLVMLTFVGPSDLRVNHKNGIKTDNRLENLEYVTPKQNIVHAHNNGFVNSSKGEDRYNSKLTEKDILQIRELYLFGSSLTSIAKLYGVCFQSISFIVNRKTWKHVN